MKLVIEQLIRVVICACFTNATAGASPITNEEPSHILIEAVILSVPKNPAANSLLSAGNRLAVPANFYLGDAVGWFTNVYPVIGQQNGVEYVAKFRDELTLTTAALGNNCPPDVVQRPRILTSAGKAAQFFVGQPPPYGGFVNFPDYWTGIELDVTPELAPGGSLAMNIQCVIEARIEPANVPNYDKAPVVSFATNSVSATVRNGEIFMVVCAMDPLPEKSSIFRKSIHAIGALFGHHPLKRDKRETIILFRARQISTIKWDERGRYSE